MPFLQTVVRCGLMLERKYTALQNVFSRIVVFFENVKTHTVTWLHLKYQKLAGERPIDNLTRFYSERAENDLDSMFDSLELVEDRMAEFFRREDVDQGTIDQPERSLAIILGHEVLNQYDSDPVPVYTPAYNPPQYVPPPEYSIENLVDKIFALHKARSVRLIRRWQQVSYVLVRSHRLRRRNAGRVLLRAFARVREMRTTKPLPDTTEALIPVDKGKAREITNTAFPRLGHEDIDGCDCWLPDPSTDDSLPKHLLNILFGVHPPNFLHLLGGALWFWQTGKRENVVIEKLDATFIVYVATDCHLVEGEVDRKIGHSFSEYAMIRQQKGSYKVLSFRDHVFFQDLSDFVEDQHLHASLIRSIVRPTPMRAQASQEASTFVQGPSGANISRRDDEMVERQGVMMTRAQKREMRKATRAENSALRAQGIKPVKSFQVPLRFRGLTTQEYHEMVAREKDEMLEAIGDRGWKALPQAVKEYLKSKSGSERWNQIHNFAVTDRHKAENALKKLNILLRMDGLVYDLTLNENIIESMRKKQQRARELRDQQVASADTRLPKQLRAQAKHFGEADRPAVAYSGPGKAWADYDDGDDSLPSLDDFGRVPNDV